MMVGEWERLENQCNRQSPYTPSAFLRSYRTRNTDYMRLRAESRYVVWKDAITWKYRY